MSNYLLSTCHGVVFGDMVTMPITGKPPLPASHGGHVWIPAARWAVPAPHGLPFPAPDGAQVPVTNWWGVFSAGWLHGARLPFIRHPSTPEECCERLSINLNKPIHGTGWEGFVPGKLEQRKH